MSKGTPPKRWATATTSVGATNRNTACGSTKRRMSQGQAIRSILGRARVTHTVLPRASTGGSLANGTNGSLSFFHAEASLAGDYDFVSLQHYEKTRERRPPGMGEVRN
jgi:hypothetical protein